MQAVILAAGKGTRMKELTDKLPKSLLLVSGRPILEYILDNLPDEINEVVFVVGHKGELIKKYLGDKYNGKRIKYIEQKELNGTAGALWQVKDILRDKFLVLNGDDFYDKKDLQKAITNELSILTKETQDPGRFGVIELDEKGNLTGIAEKPKNPKTNLVVIGAYVLNKKIFDYKPIAISETEFGLPQTIAEMAADWPIKVEKADFWHPHNAKEDIERTEKIMRKKS